MPSKIWIDATSKSLASCHAECSGADHLLQFCYDALGVWYIDGMMIFSRSVWILSFALLLAGAARAQPAPTSAAADSNARLDTASNNILLNIDIFGQAAVGSYYILWDNLDLSAEMKTILTSRNFATDHFFMQNIDREQFEQERVLQLFEDKKREYFKLFPDEDDDD